MKLTRRIAFRLPPSLADDFARELKLARLRSRVTISRSEMLRILVTEALEARNP